MAEGPKGTVEQPLFAGNPVEVEGRRSIEVTRPDDSGPERSLHGLLRALVANAVQGVTEGFTSSSTSSASATAPR